MNVHSSPRRTGSRVLDDLAEVIGEEAVWALAWEYRGLRFYIPKDPATDPCIAATIGDEKAGELCSAFGGIVVPMPMDAALTHRVIALAKAGRTRQEIARECRIREARVYSILSRKKDDRQLPLI